MRCCSTTSLIFTKCNGGYIHKRSSSQRIKIRSNGTVKQRPKRRWFDENVQRAELERVGRERFGVRELDDWYKVNASKVNLSFLQNYYKGSLFTALKTLYPQHNWDPRKITSQVPRGYWTDVNVQREALEKLGREKFGVKELDDWYKVPTAEVACELSFIRNHYQGAVFNALVHLYPEHNWDPLHLSKAPFKYWTDEDAQRDALEKLGREKFGVKELDDWYNVSTSEKELMKLSFIVAYYKGSLYNTLKTLYPHHNWDPLSFVRVPRKYWKSEQAMDFYRDIFSKWKTEHNIQNAGDWYLLPPSRLQLFKRVSRGMFGSVQKLLKEWFAHTAHNVSTSQWTSQIELQAILQHLVAASVPSKEPLVPVFAPSMQGNDLQQIQRSWESFFNTNRKQIQNKRLTRETSKQSESTDELSK